MLSMGITLSVDDFKRVLAKPTIMLLGFAACYLLMPALALGLSSALGLPAALTAGMVLGKRHATALCYAPHSPALTPSA